jgi:hypothetical protein
MRGECGSGTHTGIGLTDEVALQKLYRPLPCVIGRLPVVIRRILIRETLANTVVNVNVKIFT